MADPVWLDDDQQRTWRSLAALLTLLPGALDAQLQDEAGIPHTHYMMLAMLSEAPDRTLRMSALARTTSVSPSRLSHAVRALEQRGWVERRPSPEDRRGQLAVLTAAGLQAVSAFAPGHVAQVRRLVFDRLDEAQTAQLGALLEQLTRPLRDDAER